jgi:SAM-dependent methyltransferase
LTNINSSLTTSKCARKCWGNETASTMAAGKSIQTYIGVEPNRYFADAIKKEKVRTQLPFQVNILYSSAIQLPDIEDSSVDSVIGTHVLCSIDNVDPVLREIGRILKPGGRYYFLEHVRVKQEGSWQHLAQQMLSPLFRIVGNGCQFKPLWQRFDAHSALLDFKYEEWSAPIPLPFVKPHLIGYATRRGEPGSHLLKKQSANISEGRRNSR